MNDNSPSTNHIPDMNTDPIAETFPTDALSEYPDFPFSSHSSSGDTVDLFAPASTPAVAEEPTLVPLFPEDALLPDSPSPSIDVPSTEPAPAPATVAESAPVPTPVAESAPVPTPVAESAPAPAPATAPTPVNPGAIPTPPQQTYPAGNPRMPQYPNPRTPYGQSAPYAPPGQSPLQRGYGYPPQQEAPYGQSNPSQQGAPYGRNNPSQQNAPYGNPGYIDRNASYPGNSGGYPSGNPGQPYGNTGYPGASNGYGNPNGYSNPNGYGNPNNYSGMPPLQNDPYGTNNAPKKKKSGNWMLALLIAGCVLVGSVSGILISKFAGNSNSTTATSESPSTTGRNTQPTLRPSEHPGETDNATESQPSANVPKETQPLATASGEEKTLNQIYTENVPAIVGVTNESVESTYGQSSTSSSAGTGFIISSNGEILTNYHVVEGASSLTVSLYDGREFPATLIGYEAESDIALIKIDVENLPVCAIGNSDQIYVGEQVAAIGNPMGELTYTMTVGYVSALNRFVNTDGTPINMIQVDAAINPGNSGGPVFNLYGEVIGIATAKYSGTLSSGATLEGLGFAIPINDIVEILDDLRINGKVPDRAYMGVQVLTGVLDKEVYGIDHGVYVQSVDQGGSAYNAGLQAGDIITKIGNVEVNAYENLQQVLRGYRAGDETTITVFRSGQSITLTIVFDAKPDTTETTATEPQYTEPTTPESTESPWETFPWEDFPWGDFGG